MREPPNREEDPREAVQNSMNYHQEALRSAAERIDADLARDRKEDSPRALVTALFSASCLMAAILASGQGLWISILAGGFAVASAFTSFFYTLRRLGVLRRRGGNYNSN